MLENTVDNNIILSISLLTSNRKDTIRKCLDSLTPLRKQVSSELIIVDTGCDDEMLGIIEEYADQIVHFEWCDDFAKARNAGLEKASGEWFLFIDDDEWFEDVSEIVTFFQTGEYKKYTTGEYIIRNYGNIEGTLYEDSFLLRMAKIGENVRFHGCIHEALCVFEGETKYFNNYVHHYGYVFTSVKEKFRHHQRNEMLLRKAVERERENLRWWLHLAQEYWVVQERYQLFNLCQEVLDMTQNWSYEKIGNQRGSFYVGRILAAQRLYRYEDASQYLQEAILDKKNSQRCLAKLFSLGAEIYYEMKDYAHCIECIRSYLVCYENVGQDKNKDATIFLEDAYNDVTYSGIISIILSVALAEGDMNVIKEYFEQLGWQQERLVVYDTSLFSGFIHFIADNPYYEYFVHMAQSFMDRTSFDQSFKNTVKDTLKKIEIYENPICFGRVVRVFSQVQSEDVYISYLKIRAADMNIGIMKEQLELEFWNLFQKVENIFELDLSVWTIAKKNAIDLEPLFLRIEFQTWKRMVDDFCKNTTSEKVQNYVDILEDTIRQKENIRYRYFYLKVIEIKTVYGKIIKDYHTLHQLLQEFVRTQLEFYLHYYREEAFQGEMELLPDACKAAVYLNEAFLREEAGDYRGALLILKESIGKCASLSETIQIYSHMYVEELKRQL